MAAKWLTRYTVQMNNSYPRRDRMGSFTQNDVQLKIYESVFLQFSMSISGPRLTMGHWSHGTWNCRWAGDFCMYACV
jgi:hypothetical protein